MNGSCDKKSIMIIAGEASGDIHGSMLVKAMKKKNNGLVFFGIGGNMLKEAGVEIIRDASTLAVVGITEVVSKIFSLIKGIVDAKKALKALHPDLMILIDFPDFNLKIAAAAKKLDIPVLYYISPQVWAWRQGRVKKLKNLVTHLAVILPFEKDFFKKYGIPATYVGHPLLDGDPLVPDNANKTDNKRIGLLPGSRDREVARHLPVMLKAASLINKKQDIEINISLSPTVKRQHVENIMRKQGFLDYNIISEGTGRILKNCSLVIAASGTVTLEAAIAGVPMVIIYKVSPVSYLLGKALIKVSYICLVNLISGREIVPELIQKRATPENIAHEALKMLNNPEELKAKRKELIGIREMLGGQGASERVADIALLMLQT